VRTLRYAIPFVFLATAPLGFVLGGAWSWLTLLATPAGICGFDYLLGFEPEIEPEVESLAYRALPWLYIAAQLAVIAWAAFAVAGPAVTLVEAIGLTVSVGMTAGIFGILAAHEMVHRDVRWERGIGVAFLAGVGYMHFRIAHLQGHHRRGATFEDPASARKGESAYGFILRSSTGQFREAWAFEAARLRRRGRRVWGPSNRMLHYAAVQIVVVAAVALLGPRALGYWLVQAVLAVIMLELFNYIAHYGLSRRTLPNGKLERMASRHSWNSSRRMNNWALFNMGRHSDHHTRPTRAYQRLEPEPDSPELPAGYCGAIVMALLPPLWRLVMDPRVDVWMGAGLSATLPADAILMSNR
jgi:alkane 1-monooxygenase